MVDSQWLSERVQSYFAGETTPRADDGSDWQGAVERLLGLVAAGERHDAYLALRGEASLDDASKKLFVTAVNDAYLFERDLEWTNHGILRSFRFWTPDQKTAYLTLTTDIMGNLRELTPHVSLGFGSVLAVMRDKDFIPHDDDMDIIVAFERTEFDTITEALARVEELMRSRGYTTSGDLPTHRNVNLNGGTAVDVFVGLIEDGRVSWFPSRRGGLQVDQVFPTQTVDFLGIKCDIPARPEEYLATTYGPDWATPISNWNHPWNRAEYEDLI